MADDGADAAGDFGCGGDRGPVNRTGVFAVLSAAGLCRGDQVVVGDILDSRQRDSSGRGISGRTDSAAAHCGFWIDLHGACGN